MADYPQETKGRRALTTGITGQDGGYLTEFLGDPGYHVFGLITGQAHPRGEPLREPLPCVELVGGDRQDFSSLIAAVNYAQPDEVYNLGHLVRAAFVQAARADGERHRPRRPTALGGRPDGGRSGLAVKFYQASSSEMFGKVRESPQTEQTPPTRGARTEQPRYSATRSRSTTARRTDSSGAAGSFSTTNRRAPATSS